MEEALEKLDLEMKEKISDIKKEYSEKKKAIKKKFKQEQPKEPKPKRTSIPKSLKIQVWNEYIGKEKGVGNCLCCNTEIDSKKFDCGHIEAVNKGGLTVLENLRPICSTCNKSMGDQNMFEFRDTYFPKKDEGDKHFESNEPFIYTGGCLVESIRQHNLKTKTEQPNYLDKMNGLQEKIHPSLRRQKMQEEYNRAFRKKFLNKY